MSKLKFRGNPDFCAECGSILPLPDVDRGLTQCVQCKSNWKTKEVVGEVLWKYEENLVQKTVDVSTSAQADGPEVDRICSKCGHNKMSYATRQTRSADEGMTVFFTCTKCAHKDIEYS